MRVKDRLIYLTKAEKLWLQDFRLAAIKQCPNLELARDIRERTVPFPWRILVRVGPRSADGSLPCKVWVQHRERPITYSRERTCRVSVGSTSGRYLQLREGTGPNTIQRNGARLSGPKGQKTRGGAL